MRLWQAGPTTCDMNSSTGLHWLCLGAFYEGAPPSTCAATHFLFEQVWVSEVCVLHGAGLALQCLPPGLPLIWVDHPAVCRQGRAPVVSTLSFQCGCAQAASSKHSYHPRCWSLKTFHSVSLSVGSEYCGRTHPNSSS